ncbi:hypothetical protein HMPREF2617_00935 [Corynebacterium sp. HMSC070H05]|uniref:hypothetical protein n=1 Tax=Corynebacterium sp. HMSC070H05 TaxID=1715096 RepID=UPI0008A9A703|nr:hypothetical protein [Corynebacterium sp. HMSC070H05]OHQ51225.1 hypothetical protein HMPREF2617_00935 [Corynebacterium sp. HMSC070H05]
MKTRTSLIVAATVTAVAFTGAGVAQAAPTVVGDNTTNTTNNGGSSSNEEGSSSRDMSPSEIQDWLAVVTAIIGILSQVATVAMKFMR